MIQNFSASTTKKALILAAIAMMTLAACTKFEDTAPPRKITFETAIYRPQTKAEVSIMSEFQNFKCKAFLHAEGYSDAQNMFGENGETISAYTSGNEITTTSGNVAYWAPSHDYYWPKGTSSYINFVSWYDARNIAPTTATETSLVWENYEVKTTDNLLYADEAWHYKATPDADYHKDGSVTKGVPMLFHHALAKLCIKAAVTSTKKANVTGGNGLGITIWKVTLSEVKLTGVYKKGSLSLTNSDPGNNATKAWTGTWNFDGQTTSDYTMAAVTTPLKETAVDLFPTSAGGMESVLPQAVTSSMKLVFDYNIDTYFVSDINADINTELNTADRYAQEKIHAEIPLSSFSFGDDENPQTLAKWEMNKIITYTISIDPVTTTIKIDPAMVDWILQPGGTTTL